MIELLVGIQWLPWVLAAGVLLASLRLLLQARTAGVGARRWRIAVLVVGQSLAALLLFLLLRSETPTTSVHTLYLLTARAPAGPAPAPAPGERVLRLPEAPVRPGVPPIPDLATALRRHPEVRVLRIAGDGLEARDLDATGGRRLVFTPAPLARGITDWWALQKLSGGEPLRVAGTTHASFGLRISLLEPGGSRVDEQVLQADGGFALQAIPRTDGLAEYRLQLRDSDGKQIDTSNLPVRIEASAPTSVLLLAGGPDPDLKYLRRWAADHGARLQASIELGGGMRAGDPPFALDAPVLGQTDLLILDDRSWNALDGRRRGAVMAAVDAGMGLLLRASQPLAHAGLLGLRVRPATLPATYRIPGAADGTDAPPLLARPQLRIENPRGPTLLRDDRGLALAAWRAHGRGRIGVWLPGDSFRLVLAGQSALHAQQWSGVVNALMRARGAMPPPLPLRVYAGERTLLCDLGVAPRVVAPGPGAPQPLAIDPRTGDRLCAAWWPTQAGWHRVVDGNGERPLLVRAHGDDAVLRAAHTQRATSDLAAQSTSETLADAPRAPSRLPRGLLFLAWLALMAALWWLERSRLGRGPR